MQAIHYPFSNIQNNIDKNGNRLTVNHHCYAMKPIFHMLLNASDLNIEQKKDFFITELNEIRF